MKILFIGGTGTISTSCLVYALAEGHDVTVLCRGSRNDRIPKGVRILTGDAYQLDDAVSAIIKNTEWDCVVNWAIYGSAQARMDIERFAHNTQKYFFISSTCVYDNSNQRTPILETQTFLDSQWFYSKGKVEAENEFMHAFRQTGFPVVIIRPGHTYNDFTVPTNIQGLGYGFIIRIQQQKEILIHEDGQSLWTLTHSDDFADAFTQLLAHPNIIGETIHIAAEEYHSWNEIFAIYADILGKKLNAIYLPTDEIHHRSPILGEPILNDKKFNRIFNTEKLKKHLKTNKSSITLQQGLQRVIKWHHDHSEKIYLNKKIEKELELFR